MIYGERNRSCAFFGSVFSQFPTLLNLKNFPPYTLAPHPRSSTPGISACRSTAHRVFLETDGTRGGGGYPTADSGPSFPPPTLFGGLGVGGSWAEDPEVCLPQAFFDLRLTSGVPIKTLTSSACSSWGCVMGRWSPTRSLSRHPSAYGLVVDEWGVMRSRLPVGCSNPVWLHQRIVPTPSSPLDVALPPLYSVSWPGRKLPSPFYQPSWPHMVPSLRPPERSACSSIFLDLTAWKVGLLGCWQPTPWGWGFFSPYFAITAVEHWIHVKGRSGCARWLLDSLEFCSRQPDMIPFVHHLYRTFCFFSSDLVILVFGCKLSVCLCHFWFLYISRTMWAQVFGCWTFSRFLSRKWTMLRARMKCALVVHYRNFGFRKISPKPTSPFHSCSPFNNTPLTNDKNVQKWTHLQVPSRCGVVPPPSLNETVARLLTSPCDFIDLKNTKKVLLRWEIYPLLHFVLFLFLCQHDFLKLKGLR